MVEESAKTIISHVPKGVELAKEHELPEAIVDFIRTHHGNIQLQYFYHSYLKNYPEKEIVTGKYFNIRVRFLTQKRQQS